METYNISDFINYFSTYYPVLIPAAIGLVMVLATFLDWVRTWVMGYADDFENPISLFVDPFLRKILLGEDGAELMGKSCDSRSGGAWGEIGDIERQGQGYYVSTRGYWDSIRCSTRASAELMSAHLKTLNRQDRETYVCVMRNSENPLVGSLVVCGILLFLGSVAVLTTYFFFPVFTMVLVTSYLTLRLTRTVVRLAKKVKAHIADPKAHPSNTGNSETQDSTGPR